MLVDDQRSRIIIRQASSLTVSMPISRRIQLAGDVLQNTVRSFFLPTQPPPKEVPFISQGTHSKLCWAACALMLLEYLGISEPALGSDPVEALAEKVLKQKKPKQVMETEAPIIDVYNVAIGILELPSIYESLGVMFDAPAGPLDEAQLEEQMFGSNSGPILIYYGSGNDGHVVIIAKAEKDWAGLPSYYRYDPLATTAPERGVPAGQLNAYSSLQWACSFCGCRRAGVINGTS